MVLDSGKQFRQFLDQVHGYEKRNPDTHFVLLISGGRDYQNARVWIIQDFNDWLTERATHVE